ncbi:YchJ family protein [Aeromicrobium sp.]|uniref:YchJ family protein n=1 Tax=Aeromicrobium sp. TaxID=1871063 RepID=UPI0030BBCB11
MKRCPCLSGLTYEECCGPLHAGSAVAQTAEQLMRSRYSAFAEGNADYLVATWDPTTRPDAAELDDGRHWYRLDILRTERGGPFDDTGIVEFRAYHRSAGGNGSQHETSSFRRQAGRWLYVDGIG